MRGNRLILLHMWNVKQDRLDDKNTHFDVCKSLACYKKREW